MNRFKKPMSWNLAGSSTPPSAGDRSESRDTKLKTCDFTMSEDDHGNPVESDRAFFLPLHYSPGYQYPLIVWLHSDGFNEKQIEQVLPHISVRNYVGVGVRGNRATDSSGHRFDWHSSRAGIGIAHDLVMDAAEEACDRYSVRPDRIVLAGYGAGGTMAIRIAMRDPRRVAAAVSIGGRMPQGEIRNLNQLRARRLPMLWQWAQQNAEYTTDGLKADCQAAMSIAAKVQVRQYPGDHEMDTIVLDDLNRWMMEEVVSVSSKSSDRWRTTPTTYSSN